MSMLHDYKNGKAIELPYIWDGFEKISKILELKMDFTKELCERVLKKVNQ